MTSLPRTRLDGRNKKDQRVDGLSSWLELTLAIIIFYFVKFGICNYRSRLVYEGLTASARSIVIKCGRGGILIDDVDDDVDFFFPRIKRSASVYNMVYDQPDNGQKWRWR